MEEKKEFGWARSKFWPIHNHELKKFIPMFAIFFCISFIYSVLRNVKDIFIMSKAASESITLVKILVVLPAAFIFTAIYNSVSNRLKRDQLFNLTVIFFLSFFAFFLFFLAPNLENLKPTAFANSMRLKWPTLEGAWAAIENWPVVLFYMMSELWGTFALSVLFWTFANKITNLKQAKRFYSFLMIGANIGLFAAGLTTSYFKESAMSTIFFVLLAGITLLVVHILFVRAIDSDPESYQLREEAPKKKKVKLSLSESLSVLVRSKYLGLITLLVLSYGVTINLAEAVWKNELKIYSKLPGLGEKFLSETYSKQNFITAIATIFMVVFLSSSVAERGWRFTALVTPVASLFLSSMFFIALLFGEDMSGIFSFMSITPIYLAIMLGLAQVSFIKAAKYAFFDPTKERAYLPLDDELKTKGKAAVDGIGGRLGKSLGAVIVQAFVISGDGTISSAKQYFAPIIGATFIIWILAAITLSREFTALTSSSEEN